MFVSQSCPVLYHRLLFPLKTWTGATCASPSVTAHHRTVSINVSFWIIRFFFPSFKWPTAQLARSSFRSKYNGRSPNQADVLHSDKYIEAHPLSHYSEVLVRPLHEAAASWSGLVRGFWLGGEKCLRGLICLLGPVCSWMQPVLYVLLFFNILSNFRGIKGQGKPGTRSSASPSACHMARLFPTATGVVQGGKKKGFGDRDRCIQ